MYLQIGPEIGPRRSFRRVHFAPGQAPAAQPRQQAAPRRDHFLSLENDEVPAGTPQASFAGGIGMLLDVDRRGLYVRRSGGEPPQDGALKRRCFCREGRSGLSNEVGGRRRRPLQAVGPTGLQDSAEKYGLSQKGWR